jgi:hypothetical protein
MAVAVLIATFTYLVSYQVAWHVWRPSAHDLSPFALPLPDHFWLVNIVLAFLGAAVTGRRWKRLIGTS